MSKNGIARLKWQGTKWNVNTPLPIKKFVYLSIDLDTGNVLIDESNFNRKIEPVPMGFYVHFCTIEKAMRLKRRFEKKPYLIEKFLNR
jgi:hypothetical protein